MTSAYTPMIFEQLADSITAILIANEAANGFITLGYQDRTINPEDVEDDFRTVRVYYQSGAFPKASSPLRGPHVHECVFDIELVVGKSATMDLSVVNDPAATPAERSAAMAAGINAESLVDRAMNELARNVFQILMDNRNIHLGLEGVSVSNRHFPTLRKDEIIQRGSLAVLTGNAQITCRCQEPATGVVPVPASIGSAVLADVITDGTGKAAVLTGG